MRSFLERPLEGDWPDLWIDATYVKVREAGRIVSVAVTIAVAVNSDGRREVLGMAIGASEAETFWVEFLRKLKRRGLAGVKLVISDAHEGIKAAVARGFRATWQRCRMHFMRNALAHAGRSGRRVVSAKKPTVFVTSRISVGIAPTANGHSKRTQMYQHGEAREHDRPDTRGRKLTAHLRSDHLRALDLRSRRDLGQLGADGLYGMGLGVLTAWLALSAHQDVRWPSAHARQWLRPSPRRRLLEGCAAERGDRPAEGVVAAGGGPDRVPERFRNQREPRLRAAFERQAGYVSSHCIDHRFGDWLYSGGTFGLAVTIKANTWKEPYHQGRAAWRWFAGWRRRPSLTHDDRLAEARGYPRLVYEPGMPSAYLVRGCSANWR